MVRLAVVDSTEVGRLVDSIGRGVGMPKNISEVTDTSIIEIETYITSNRHGSVLVPLLGYEVTYNI